MIIFSLSLSLSLSLSRTNSGSVNNQFSCYGCPLPVQSFHCRSVWLPDTTSQSAGGAWRASHAPFHYIPNLPPPLPQPPSPQFSPTPTFQQNKTGKRLSRRAVLLSPCLSAVLLLLSPHALVEERLGGALCLPVVLLGEEGQLITSCVAA